MLVMFLHFIPASNGTKAANEAAQHSEELTQCKAKDRHLLLRIPSFWAFIDRKEKKPLS